MGDHEPTITDDGQQDGEQLDADLLPDEFPDDRPLAAREYGVTEAEQARRESLDRRLRREEPDVLGDDDAAAADDGDDGDDEGSPDLLSQLDDGGHDLEKDLVGERAGRERHPDDSGQPRNPRSAEEDAIHVVDADDDLGDDLGDGPDGEDPAAS